MDKQATLARAKALRKDDDLEGSQELLLQLLEEYPNDPVILFEVGGSYDVMGQESDAIPYYQKALNIGLKGDDLQECLICLGSSQRVVGRYEEAITTLTKAVGQFPNDNSGRAFLALAYYSNGQCHEAVKLLLDLLLATTEDEDILAYSGALEYYKDNLDEVWEE
jgi:tetratricopeptide (TPR) repeat protein